MSARAALARALAAAVRRAPARRTRAAALLTLAAALGPAAAARAEAPQLHITSPTGVSNNTIPMFSGTSSGGLEDENPVIVRVYKGTPEEQDEVDTITAGYAPVWFATADAPLAAGSYAAVAEQASEEGERGFSEPAFFTIDTTAPAPTILSPTGGSSSAGSSQTVSGAAGTEAGDQPTITVQLFAGAEVGLQTPIETLAVQAQGGAWSATFGGLAPGTYTVRALQSDEAGNRGVSPASTFTLLAGSGPPPPASPNASFVWVPGEPHPGETVTLVSTSTDLSAPITSLAWSVGAAEPFIPGTQMLATEFPAAGAYTVRLRALDANGNASVASHSIAVTNAPLPLMAPFPVVRIVGSLTSSGAHITLLSVQAPVSARVTVGCRGRSCPTRSVSHVAAASKHRQPSGTALLTFGRFARTLRAGVVLQIRVTKTGEIGKYTRFVIRRGHVPARSDDCLWPSSPSPTNCP